jgi:hypothetical protein
MPTETDEILGYDADHDDPRQYCPHGAFIGSWWGPDYLCGACEQGISAAAYRYSGIQRNIFAWEDRLGWFCRLADNTAEVVEHKSPTYRNWFRNIVVDLVLTKYDESMAIMHQINLAHGQLVYFWLDHPDFDPDDESQWGY